jgi:hypothetical protein
MRFQPLLLAALAGLVPSAAADHLETTWVCNADLFVMCGAINRPYSHINMASGRYFIPTMDECYGSSVPGLRDYCMDWDNNRAHFTYTNPTRRRCFRKRPVGRRFTDDSCPGIECWHDTWPEVACDW